MQKIPPQAKEFEEAVLGACLIDPDAVAEAVETLRSNAFYIEGHQLIFQAIKTLYSKNDPVDLLTVTDQLRKSGDLEQAGGAFYVTELTSKVGSSAHLKKHCLVILEKYVKREIIKVGSKIIEQAYDDQQDALNILSGTDTELSLVNDILNGEENSEHITELITQEILSMSEAAKQKGLVGVPTGFKELDTITGGWQKSDLIIVAGRPAMGKTAFMLTLARTANVNVGIASLEMSKSQLTKRVISSATEVQLGKIRDPKNLTQTDWKTIYEKVEGEQGIYITDTPAMHINAFRSWARKMHKKHNCKMFIVDYLQLMKADANSREQEISTISRTLKQVAKELNCPVVSLAQLNREVEKRQDKRPTLADLRESGAIEQDADIITFLYRPAYYGLSPEAGEPIDDAYAELIIAKHRNGSTGLVSMRFKGEFVKFLDYDNFSEENVPF